MNTIRNANIQATLENVMILILGALLTAAFAIVLGSGIAGTHRSNTSIS